MDIQKEKTKKEFWVWAKTENPRLVENAELGDVYAIQNLDHMFMGFAAAKAQAVPEGFVLVDKHQLAQAVPEGFVLVDKHQLAQLMANMDSFGKKALGDDYVSFADIAAVLDEAQEPTND